MGKLMCLLFWECHYSTLSPSKRSVKARGKRRTFTGSWTRFPIDCTFVHDDFIKVDNVLLTERFQPLITLLLIFVVRGFSPRDSSYLRFFEDEKQTGESSGSLVFSFVLYSCLNSKSGFVGKNAQVENPRNSR